MNEAVGSGLFVAENIQAEEFITAQKLPEAARVLVDIVDKDPGNYRAFNSLGIISWMQGAWEDAYSMFKKSILLRPDYSDALINLFDAALKLRRVKDVVPDFATAVSINPELSEIQKILTAISEEGEAIYQSQRALVIGIHNPEIEAANQLLSDGKLNDAMAKFLAIHDSQGPHAEVFAGLGIISFYQKRYADAYSMFVESIKLDPTKPDTYINLLDAALEIDKTTDAREIYDHYKKELPWLSSISDEFSQVLAKGAKYQ